MPRDRQLAGLLQEFARTLLTDYPIQPILDRLVEDIVDVLPITSAGITTISSGLDARYVAASDTSAVLFEELQTAVGEGPCFAAFRSGRPVIVGDVRHDLRYPTFAGRATALGLRAAFAFPLRIRGEGLGALNLYRHTIGPLDVDAMGTAQTFADVATAYLINSSTPRTT